MKTNGPVTIASAKDGTPFMEAYGLLLVSVILGSNGKPVNVVAVSSAQAGNGTTTTALNLAMMMARGGRPTLLVDANLRHPTLHSALGVAEGPGLAEALKGEVEPRKSVSSTQIPNLSLMPAGKTGTMTAQALLNQGGLDSIFNVLRERYDLVVIDTPPILQYPDAMYVSKHADGVLMVVPSQGASRREQVEARRLLDRVEARILGTVLNRVRPRERTPLVAVF
jgi:capsular exopolysaccharide synthesis family protein